MSDGPGSQVRFDLNMFALLCAASLGACGAEPVTGFGAEPVPFPNFNCFFQNDQIFGGGVGPSP